MSWSRRARPLFVAGTLLGASTLLGACSFSPVYNSSLASQPLLNLAYAKPTTRLEQIIYQDLSLRFGMSASASAPLATVRATAATAGVTMTASANPAPQTEVTVTATLTVTRRDGGDTSPIALTRVATAVYTTSNQVLANRTAEAEATERAAKAAAESLRLALLAALSR